ncbi:hypothetical protein D3C80_1392140 [compost metagenome]
MGGKGQGVVAGHRRRVGRLVVAERTHAGEAVEDVLLVQLALEVAIDHIQQVAAFLGSDRHLCRVAVVLAVGGADQGEAFQVGDGEDDAAILVLQDVGLLAVVQARHDDVAALDQANAVGRLLLEVMLDEACHPGASGVDQGAGADRQQAAVGALQVDVPEPLATPGADATGARMHMGTALPRGHGVEHHQPGVVHPAVGVFETAGDLGLQRAAGAEAQAAGGG